jgi:hypothetical protein
MKSVIWVVLLLTLVVVMVPASLVHADGPPLPAGTRVLPDLGPSVPGQTPGVNGYKVFGPNAVRRVPIRPSVEGGETTAPLTLYRSGYTDVWYTWGGPFQPYVYNGSHTSDSDLWEEQIWVDGYLKRRNQIGWMNNCRDHTAGSRAQCNTSFEWSAVCAYGESQHFFHTTGYADDHFTTSDQNGPLGTC